MACGLARPLAISSSRPPLSIGARQPVIAPGPVSAVTFLSGSAHRGVPYRLCSAGAVPDTRANHTDRSVLIQRLFSKRHATCLVADLEAPACPDEGPLPYGLAERPLDCEIRGVNDSALDLLSEPHPAHERIIDAARDLFLPPGHPCDGDRSHPGGGGGVKDDAVWAVRLERGADPRGAGARRGRLAGSVFCGRAGGGAGCDDAAPVSRAGAGALVWQRAVLWLRLHERDRRARQRRSAASMPRLGATLVKIGTIAATKRVKPASIESSSERCARAATWCLNSPGRRSRSVVTISSSRLSKCR